MKTKRLPKPRPSHRQPNPQSPSFEQRLECLVRKALDHARSAQLQHFRYCACSQRAPRDAASYRRRLDALEADLAANSENRLSEAVVFDQLQELALLGQPPADLAASQQRAARSLITEALLELR